MDVMAFSVLVSGLMRRSLKLPLYAVLVDNIDKTSVSPQKGSGSIKKSEAPTAKLKIKSWLDAAIHCFSVIRPPKRIGQFTREMLCALLVEGK